MRVFIAEKPSVAKAIADAIGITAKEDGYFKCKDSSIVTYCFGHLLERAAPDYYLSDSVPVNSKTNKKIWRREDLPIIPDKFIKLVSSDKKKQVKIIKTLIKDASEVINAGDPDREGQLLVDEVLEYLEYKGKVSRYWQSAMDPVSVKRALKNIVPNDKFYKWGVAAEGRGIADWLVGMNYSRQLTIKNHQLISVGRVQTPVLKIVADRDLAIENFKPHDFYNIEATFSKDIISYKGKLDIPDDLLDPEGQLTDLKNANELKTTLQKKDVQGMVVSVVKQTKKTLPPLLFTLADLQVECSKQFNLSAKQTLDIAQELYEKYKLTTYPRSSCEFLPDAQKEDVLKILNFLSQGIPAWQKFIDMAKEIKDNRIFNDKKVNEAAHTGIAPTPKAVTISEINSLPELVKKVYLLIVKRYIACFMPAYIYEEMVIQTKVDSYTFKTILKAPRSYGFKEFAVTNEPEDPDNVKNLPNIKERDLVSVKNVEMLTGKTTPPKYFTEGSLIQAMRNISKFIEDPEEKKLLKETDGLGTEATRAEIIERLKKHEFIEISKTGKTKGKIISTAKGREALKVIPKKLQSASITAHDEERLRQILDGILSLDVFIDEKEKELRNTMNEIDKDSTTVSTAENYEKCPKCGSRLYRNEAKNIKGLFYWRCSNRECGIFLDDLKGKPVEKKTCPKCGTGKLTRYESKYQKGLYTWCCNNQSCKARFQDQNYNVGQEILPKGPVDSSKYLTCPSCKAERAVTLLKSKKSGKTFFKCIKCNSLFCDDNGKIGNCFSNKK